MSWLHFYKWGRQETVTFRTPSFRAQKGDVMFFVLDGFLIGDALIAEVRHDVFIEGWGLVHEVDVAEGQIWEYIRPFTVWDKLLDKLRLSGLKNEVPSTAATRWLETYRAIHGPFEVHPGWFEWEPRGQPAVYNPDVLPPFFRIKKK